MKNHLCKAVCAAFLVGLLVPGMAAAAELSAEGAAAIKGKDRPGRVPICGVDIKDDGKQVCEHVQWWLWKGTKINLQGRDPADVAAEMKTIDQNQNYQLTQPAKYWQELEIATQRAQGTSVAAPRAEDMNMEQTDAATDPFAAAAAPPPAEGFNDTARMAVQDQVDPHTLQAPVFAPETKGRR
ncbi:MAG: hypothetical protein GC129_02935 [Proteobacteria bacterium]|nr:hypothetical protein [Pseudomonadota bacterium]